LTHDSVTFIRRNFKTILGAYNIIPGVIMKVGDDLGAYLKKKIIIGLTYEFF
jgi:hypothetical protein